MKIKRIFIFIKELIFALLNNYIFRQELEIIKLDLETSKIPANHEQYKFHLFHYFSYRIALLSDFHHTDSSRTPRTPKWLLDTAFESLSKEKPDIIFVLGDFIDYSPNAIDDFVQNIASKLRANDGIYGVFGNHDIKHSYETKMLLKKKMYFKV